MRFIFKTDYEQDLRTLVDVLRPSHALEVWLHVVPTAETADYVTIASTLPSLPLAEKAATIRRALAAGRLFRFSEAPPRQITTVMRY